MPQSYHTTPTLLHSPLNISRPASYLPTIVHHHSHTPTFTLNISRPASYHPTIVHHHSHIHNSTSHGLPLLSSAWPPAGQTGYPDFCRHWRGGSELDPCSWELHRCSDSWGHAAAPPALQCRCQLLLKYILTFRGYLCHTIWSFYCFINNYKSILML